MKRKQTKTARVLDLARTQGMLRPRDLAKHGLHQEILRRLVAQGLLLRHARGIYTLTNATLTENHSLAAVCKRVPDGVICLLSALQFHALTTQSPFEVWLTIDGKARAPRSDTVSLRIIRATGQGLTYGIEVHRIEGVPVRIYSAAKTVADCFKHRNKIGLDVALEALRDCRRKKKASADDIWRAAEVCRVTNVMRPYMEAMQ